MKTIYLENLIIAKHVWRDKKKIVSKIGKQQKFYIFPPKKGVQRFIIFNISKRIILQVKHKNWLLKNWTTIRLC